LLEEPDETPGIAWDGDTVRIEARPFQVLTLRIGMAEGGKQR
jgi:hypothetical protein